MNELITTLENMEDLSALAEAGADMILIPVQGISSCPAQKLDMAELEQTVAQVKAMSKRAAILANVTFHEGMLEKVEAILLKLKELAVDAIFFADPAMMYLAKKYDLVDRLVYEPETMMTSVRDADWWLRRGIQGISISPLLTLGETEEIAAATEKAVITVHGRTLMSRSYRQLLSAYKDKYQVDDKLQSNRELYLIESKRDGKMPIYEDETGTLIYSDDVLASFDFIGDLMKAKPLGLQVNGSYLPLDEQIQAIRAYRRIIDGEDAVTVGKEYIEQFQNELIDSGYYEQKTVK